MKYSAIAIIIFLASCTTSTNDVFQKTMLLSKHEWASADKKTFTFLIQDTTALYNISVVLRHADAYRYNNIWMNITTQSPDKQVFTQQLDMKLGDNTKGWLGTGMDDIYEHRIMITRQPIALKEGEYNFTLQQIMREDPLQYILNAGILIEKVRP
jgi:gliding motility-associated lipoprotein GldH